MDAHRINLDSVKAAEEALDQIGTGNSRLMAQRAIHINILLKQVPGPDARRMKETYNEIGAEAAVNKQVYAREEGAVTDMIVMGTIYQHREARRILADDPVIRPWLDAIEAVVENCRETTDA
jgi:hypothetical protein